MVVIATEEVHNCLESDNHNGDKDKESPIGANEEKEGNKVDTIVLGNHATECPPLTIKNEMQIMFLRLGFSQMVA